MDIMRGLFKTKTHFNKNEGAAFLKAVRRKK